MSSIAASFPLYWILPDLIRKVNVVLAPGLSETDRNTQLFERGIVGIGGIPVGLGFGGIGGCCAIILPRPSTNSNEKLGSTPPTKLARNKLAK